MKQLLFAAVLFAVATFASAAELQQVAEFPNQQVTGVGVSKTGRVFVNFPYWSDDHLLSVAEIVKGKPVPYPNEEWNKAGPPANHFICVQSVVPDANDNLWILDPAAPKMQEIVANGPKLVKVDLKTNQVVQTIPFGEEAAPKKSYLNDARIDTQANYAFMTDSGTGAIVVVNLATGEARRLLHGHKSTQAEPDLKLVVDGKELYDEQKKGPPQINSDGIALDSANDYLYYHALTGHTLYRIKTAYLKDANISEKDLEAKVEEAGQTAAPDGMLEGPNGAVYLTNLEANAIDRWDPNTRQVTTVIKDKRLLWPDTLSWGPNQSIYVTASQIENMARFNGGRAARTEPYKLWKVVGLTGNR